MAVFALLKTALLAACVSLVSAHNVNHIPNSVVTITIPYSGTCTTSTTILPCGHDVTTVIIETPTSTSCEATTSSGSSLPTSSSTSVTSSSTSASTTRATTTLSTTTRASTSTTTSSSTTTTTTTIPTPTPGGPCPLVKPACPPNGLDIDYYSNPFTGYSRQGGPLTWSYYITQGLTPRQSSLTNVAFFPQDTGPPANLPKIYPDPAFPTAWYAIGWQKLTNGGISVDANNFTLVYTGFYAAPETGVYSLCTTADNENDIFFGHGNAFSCLDGSTDATVKPLVVSTGGNYINGIKCADVSLVQGARYPIRSVMGNWQGPSAFNLTIKTPSETFEQRKNDFTGQAYPRSCGLFV